MERLLSALAMPLATIIFVGCSREPPAPALPPAAVQPPRPPEDFYLDLSYEVPEPSVAATANAVGGSGLAAPNKRQQFDPNQKIYDDALVKRHVDWALSLELPGYVESREFWLTNGQGPAGGNVIDVKSLGGQPAQLVQFLKTYLHGKRKTQTHRITDVDLATYLRNAPPWPTSRRIAESP